ncbi:MAG: DUF4212 domain-containing protein [Rhodospirillales bacterium]|nr:DUF4212 domain-containing protein [Rhodospirillales bacterium]
MFGPPFKRTKQQVVCRCLPPEQDVAPEAIAPPAPQEPLQRQPRQSSSGSTRSRGDLAGLDLHWAKTKKLAASVLFVWVVCALAIHLAAGSLNEITFIGFPLGYYLAAQGSLLGILALLCWFTKRQGQIDNEAARYAMG